MKLSSKDMAEAMYESNLECFSGSKELAKETSLYECKLNGTIMDCKNIDYWREVAEILRMDNNNQFKLDI